MPTAPETLTREGNPRRWVLISVVAALMASATTLASCSSTPPSQAPGSAPTADVPSGGPAGADASRPFPPLSAPDVTAVKALVMRYAGALSAKDCALADTMFPAENQYLRCGQVDVSSTKITNLHDLAGTSGIYGKVPVGARMVQVWITHRATRLPGAGTAAPFPETWSYTVARVNNIGPWRIYDEGLG